MKVVVDWPIYLDNLGHGKACPLLFLRDGCVGSYYVLTAQQCNYKPEKNDDYLFTPETLLQGASCSLQTDMY